MGWLNNTIGGLMRLGFAVPRGGDRLLGKPKTGGYQPQDTRWLRRPRDLPPLTWMLMEQMMLEPTVRLGLAMRAAPLMNAEFAYKPPGSKEYTPGIQASSQIVSAFVQRQLKTIWRDLDALLIAQRWGWAAAEVVYHLTSNRMVEVSRLLPRHPRDTRALIRDGDICGVRFLRLRQTGAGEVDLHFPKAIFHRHKPESGRYYGTSILEGPYSPWYDKWQQHGALENRRLAMMTNSFNGRRAYYPEGDQELPIGPGGEMVNVPNADVGRMMAEQLMAGAVVALPSKTDEHGNRAWEIADGTAMQGLQHVLQHPKDLDTEILRGMEIPDDVLSAENSGAWEGKKVPMMAFYSGLDGWLGGIVRDVKQQVLEPMVAVNFGPGHWFEIDTKPLAEQAMEQAKANEPQPQKVFGGFGRQDDEAPPAQPQRMSLEAIGRGDAETVEVVTAVRAALDKRAKMIRMEAALAAAEEAEAAANA